MAKKEKEIDDYINRSADFAKPVLIHLRALVHKACPMVEEKMKWSFPHFNYKNDMMCSMAAFKQHCVFSFRKAALMQDPVLIENAKSEVAMGHLGRIVSKENLPADQVMIEWIKEAMQLNDLGVKLPSKTTTSVKKKLVIPDDFIQALGENKKALQIFEQYNYAQKKEYVEWITDAKTAETRAKRIATSVEWIAEGKSRHWKHATK